MYLPPAVTVPAASPSKTVHVTERLVAPRTVAVKDCCASGARVADAGEITTSTPFAAGVAVPLQAATPSASAARAHREAG